MHKRFVSFAGGRSGSTALLAACVLGILVPRGAAAEPPPFEDWRLVVRSPIVAAGIVHVPRDELKARQADGTVVPVKLTAEVAGFLKGSAPDTTLTLTHYLNHETLSASPEFLIGLDGKNVLLFTGPDGAGGYALTKEGLVPLSPESRRRFADEIAEQKRILRDFDDEWASRKVAHLEEVKDLVNRLRSPSTAEDACKKILARGVEAVPALILSMDDDRSAGFRNVALYNRSPDAFEAIAHTGIQPTVFGAVSFLLGLITGEGFGGTQADSVNAWKVYLHHFEDLRPALQEKASAAGLATIIAEVS